MSSNSQTLGQSPATKGANVRIFSREVGNELVWEYQLIIQGEWFTNEKFYKTKVDAETAAFRMSRKLNMKLRGL